MLVLPLDVTFGRNHLQVAHVEGCRIFQRVVDGLWLYFLFVAISVGPPPLAPAVEVGAGLVEPINRIPDDRHG